MKKRMSLVKPIAMMLLVIMLHPYGVGYAEDENPSYWANDVERAREIGLVPDYLMSEYKEPITREEFASLIRQTLFVIDPMLSSDAPNLQIFSDTDSADVLFCASLGIIDGYGDGTFRPQLSIERQAAAKMLYFAANVLGKTIPTQNWLHIFADSPKISGWASGSVQWVYYAGIMEGVSHNMFDPLGTYTREQAILTVLRLFDYTKDSFSQDADRTISCNDGDILIYNRSDTLSGGVLNTRHYDMYNGDYVQMGSYVNNGASSGTSLVARMPIRDKEGTIKYYDNTNEKWVVTELKAGRYNASLICVIGESENLFIYTPRAWKHHENSTLEAFNQFNGYMSVVSSADGFMVELYAYNLPDGYRTDFTCVSSKEESLIDWKHRDAEDFWGNYTLYNKSKWCYDGYYYPSPASYIPTGENFYYRHPAAYLVKSMVQSKYTHRVALDLGLCMMDTMALQQNSIGYFPTAPVSVWLRDDYGMDGGFYDTRFNSDLIEIMIKGYSLYGGDIYYETMGKYADFFVNYANDYHRVTPSGGWYVDDYYHPLGGDRTHTSLNHQLAEIIVLYKLSDILEREDLTLLAEKMILAVEDSGILWINNEKRLHYSYRVDGNYGGQDYPYLTYNDMYHLQNLLKERTGNTNETLTMLMEYMKKWMDSNGVTEYLK